MAATMTGSLTLNFVTLADMLAMVAVLPGEGVILSSQNRNARRLTLNISKSFPAPAGPAIQLPIPPMTANAAMTGNLTLVFTTLAEMLAFRSALLAAGAGAVVSQNDSQRSIVVALNRTYPDPPTTPPQPLPPLEPPVVPQAVVQPFDPRTVGV